MDELTRIEHYYDTVPRVAAETEEIGPFTLFVAGEGTSWQFYARPRLGLTADITADDVRRVVARQDELGVPRAIEWVHETTPSLLGAVREALPGAAVEEVPLMVSRRDERDLREVPGRREVLRGDSEDLARVVGVVGASFDGHDVSGAGERRRAAPAARGGHPPHGGGVRRGGCAGGRRQRCAPRGRRGADGHRDPARGRGRGHGTAITNALRAELRERGVTTVFLTAASDDATSIYTAMGFERLATGHILEAPDE